MAKGLSFGVWDHFERRPGITVSDQYAQKIELVREAERLGYASYHVAEHHLSPLNLAPSPTVFLAAVAQATSHIRIGTGVYCLPLHHPVRLLEELCMLDNLCRGRLDVGVGRGIRAIEHEWFGVPEQEARSRFEEILAFLVRAMSTGRLSFQGKFYAFDDIALDVLPFQRPHPPIWYAGGVEFAGRTGCNFLTRTPADIARYSELYEQARERPGRINAHIARPAIHITRHVVVRRSYTEAESIARRAWPIFEANWYSTPVRVSEEGTQVPEAERGQGEDFDVALARDRRLLVGTPEMVVKRLREWAEIAGPNVAFGFSPAVQWGDISLDEALETLRLIRDEVAGVITNA